MGEQVRQGTKVRLWQRMGEAKMASLLSSPPPERRSRREMGVDSALTEKLMTSLDPSSCAVRICFLTVSLRLIHPGGKSENKTKTHFNTHQPFMYIFSLALFSSLSDSRSAEVASLPEPGAGGKMAPFSSSAYAPGALMKFRIGKRCGWGASGNFFVFFFFWQRKKS